MRGVHVVLLWIGSIAVAGAGEPDRLRLVDPEKGIDRDHVRESDAVLRSVREDDRPALRIETGTEARWPGVTFRAPEGTWDLSERAWLSVELENVGERSAHIFCRVDNEGADGRSHCITRSVRIEPRKEGSILVALTPWRPGAETLSFIGMRGNPPVRSELDPSRVTAVLLFLHGPHEPAAFLVKGITAGGRQSASRDPVRTETFFPMIDRFGQYRHADWPGKVRREEDLRERREREGLELRSRPGPEERDRWGGWSAGPRLRATGFFRVEKVHGAWWLVDPDGRLFWSHGVDCVRSSNPTPITDREHYYQGLPDTDSELARFYGRGSWAPHGYYKDHSPYRTFDFSRINLLRKYGESFEERFADVTHARLRSWGLNTIANWSDPRIYGKRRTPYTATCYFGGPRVEGSEGYWGKFHDVFHPGFRTAVARVMESQRGGAAGDPWCIGFFVDNELSWGDDTSLAIAALRSPEEQPAKQAFLDDLRGRYETIDRLNEAWGTGHASWDALRASRTAPPSTGGARADLVAFYRRTAETYFRTVRDELRRVAPDQLYLGCRFAWVNDVAAVAATRFCDVVSYNRYDYSVASLRPPEGRDVPLVIGEFHFGALDRGMFHTGLRAARDQAHRARLYAEYVRSGLRNPWVVGTHWFQYKSQPTTGRGDGENYQIGFVDICDTPYDEIVAAAREVGGSMYEIRSKMGSARR